MRLCHIKKKYLNLIINMYISQELQQVNGLEIYHDTQILSEKLIDYLEETCKHYEFVDFYEKSFTDNFKALVKDEERFKSFLKDISFTLDEFIHTAVYICPHCFTTNLIKFIKAHYINKRVMNNKEIVRKY